VANDDLKQRVSQALIRGWRATRSHLPEPMAEAIRVPTKKVFRRVGLLPDPVAAAALASPSSLPVNATWPGLLEKTSSRTRPEIFRSILGEGSGRRLLDLGAGECVFAAIGRDLGWDVTAVDARRDRLPANMDGIRFIECDVREFDPSGYDSISNLGLLYHLTLPQQEALLRACAYTRVILETQIHTPGFVPPAAEPWGREIVVEDGLDGVVYRETNQGQLADNPMASVGNETSFWVTEPSLIKLAERCGFGSVTTVEPSFPSKYGTRKFYVFHPKD
jgi:hypothetical protein